MVGNRKNPGDTNIEKDGYAIGKKVTEDTKNISGNNAADEDLDLIDTNRKRRNPSEDKDKKNEIFIGGLNNNEKPYSKRTKQGIDTEI